MSLNGRISQDELPLHKNNQNVAWFTPTRGTVGIYTNKQTQKTWTTEKTHNAGIITKPKLNFKNRRKTLHGYVWSSQVIHCMLSSQPFTLIKIIHVGPGGLTTRSEQITLTSRVATSLILKTSKDGDLPTLWATSAPPSNTYIKIKT